MTPGAYHEKERKTWYDILIGVPGILYDRAATRIRHIGKKNRIPESEIERRVERSYRAYINFMSEYSPPENPMR